MEDKDLNEMIRQLLNLTAEIDVKEKEIKEYEQTNGKFAPLGWTTEVTNKSYEMYLICKDYLNR